MTTSYQSASGNESISACGRYLRRWWAGRTQPSRHISYRWKLQHQLEWTSRYTFRQRKDFLLHGKLKRKCIQLYQVFINSKMMWQDLLAATWGGAELRLGLTKFYPQEVTIPPMPRLPPHGGAEGQDKPMYCLLSGTAQISEMHLVFLKHIAGMAFTKICQRTEDLKDCRRWKRASPFLVYFSEILAKDPHSDSGREVFSGCGSEPRR